MREIKGKGVYSMNNLIMSTQNTATKYKNVRIVLGIASVLTGIIAFCLYAFLKEEYESDISKGAMLLVFVALYFIISGFIEFIKYINYGQTFLDVYADRFIGKGIQNFGVLSFNFKREEIKIISVEKGFLLHIQTNSGTYKVMTNNDTATKILNYYNELKG